jgi:NTE family protein
MASPRSRPAGPRLPARRDWLAHALRIAVASAGAGAGAAEAPRAGAGTAVPGPPGAAGARVPGAAAAAPGARPAGIALALGSGSRHGMVHVGVIRALRSRGFRPDLITGTSAGAIAGALWAIGLDPDRLDEASRSLGWMRDLRLGWPHRGLLHADGVRALIDRHAGERPIEQWPIRFAAVATDLLAGRKVVLDRGPGGLAVAASASVPALYEPVRIDGRELVDGGLVEPVPVRTARELGAARVIAVDIAYRPWEGPVNTPVDAAFQAVHIAVNALIDEQLGAADVVLRLDVHRHFLAHGDPSSALIAAGEKAVAAQWARIAALR